MAATKKLAAHPSNAAEASAGHQVNRSGKCVDKVLGRQRLEGVAIDVTDHMFFFNLCTRSFMTVENLYWLVQDAEWQTGFNRFDQDFEWEY